MGDGAAGAESGVGPRPVHDLVACGVANRPSGEDRPGRCAVRVIRWLVLRRVESAAAGAPARRFAGTPAADGGPHASDQGPAQLMATTDDPGATTGQHRRPG